MRDEGLPGLLDHEGVALLPGGVRFADLDRLSRQAATVLEGLGVGPGDRVGLWLPNGTMWLALLFACARRGAVAVSLNTRYRAKDVGDVISRSGCRVLALSPAFKGIDFAGILRDVPRDLLKGVEALLVDEGTVEGFPIVRWAEVEAAAPSAVDLSAPEAPCAIFTTSGTTKAPKLVLHDQRTLARHARAVAAAHGMAGGLSLQILPFCGIFGFCQMMAALAAGVPTVAPPYFDAAEAAGLALEHQPTHCYGSDEMVDKLLAALPPDARLERMRVFGFARFSPALTDLPERAAAKGVPLHGLYGMSEVQALFALQPEGPHRLLPGGIPVHRDAQVRVSRPDDKGLGELEIKGPNLFLRYDGDPEATQEAFTEDGFFRTGDLGEVTEDGGFVFHTRMGDAVRLGGFLVAPAEIEAFIETHPAVDACVVVTGERDGRTVAVAFAQGEAVDEQAVIAHCKRGLAGYKVPARVIAVDAFPTTTGPNGVKIQRHVLRQRAAEVLGSRASSAAP